MPNQMPGPDTDTMIPVSSALPVENLHASLKKHPGFNGIVRRGGDTFAVFSKKPSDAIIKAVKDTT